jgi:hypothetical protein
MTQQPRNPVTGQFISNDDAYQRLLENLAYANSAAPPPTSIPRDFEAEQRLHNEHNMAAARRRALDRTIEAARERERKFVEQREREVADQQRIADVERWHEAEEKDRAAFLAAGGFPEEYQFDRLIWIRQEQERGEMRARRLPSFGAI